MAAYMIAKIAVHDPETYKQYTAQTPGTIAKYGGRFIVRGGDLTVLEGEPLSERIVIIEFPSRQAADDWFNSPEYQQIIGIRQAAATSHSFLVEGVATDAN